MLCIPGVRRGLMAIGIAVLASLAPTEPSWGVSVTTSTYATQNLPPIQTAQHPLTTVTNLTTISASVRSDVSGAAGHAAHAQAWGQAQVTSMGVTKSASGNGWLDATAPTSKSETWSSSASGSRYIVNGPAGQSVPFQFQVGIPSSQGQLTLPLTGYDPSQAQATDFGPPNVLSFNRTAIPAGNLFSSGSFDLFFDLEVAVTQNGVTQPIFNGQATLAANGQVTFGGDSQSQAFFPQFLIIDQSQGNGQLNAHFFDQRVFPNSVSLAPNTPFELTFIETMKMGNGVVTGGINDFPALTEQTGAGGSFTGSFEMLNPSPLYTLQPAVTPGDFDLDGHPNAGDISMMMTAFTDRTKFQQINGLSNADFAVMGNLDGLDSVVSNTDMQGLLVMLANSAGGGSLTAVPEPSAWILLTLGGVLTAARIGRCFAGPVWDSIP
jgi:hypothetical protein